MKVETIKSIWNFFEGKKTFFLGCLIVLVAFLHLFDYVDFERVKTFLIILNGAGLVTLRSAINKHKQTTEELK